MKYRNIKIFSLALSSILSATCLSGCGASGTYNPAVYSEETGSVMSKEFDIGEHTISVPLERDISNNITQIETVPGYEVVSLSYGSYGEVSGFFEGGTVVYTNVVPVRCETNLYASDGEVPYLNFGTPLDYVEVNETDGSVREFASGEHVLSVPIDQDITEYNYQYEHHDGYEVIGISVASYGRAFGFFDSAVVLYKNTVPVRVSKNNDCYASFGTPVEPTKTLQNTPTN